VIKHLAKLEESGLIALARGKSRGITMVMHHRVTEIRVPIVREVAKSGAIDAVDNVSGDLTLSSNVFKERPDFFIRIADTMNYDWGMRLGDLIAVKSATKAKSGEMVLLNQNGPAQFQKLMHDGAQWWLVPGNRDGGFAPQRVAPSRLQIAGLYLGLIRNHLDPQELSSGSEMWIGPGGGV